MTNENYKTELFEARLWFSTVQLACFGDPKDPPLSVASGCLIDYGGKRVLLTVSHATKLPGRWAIQLRYVPGQGNQVYGLGPMHFLAKTSLETPKKKPELIDYSYVEVPGDLQPFHQEIEIGTNRVKGETPILILKPALSETPDPSETFGFCGTVEHTWETHHGQAYLSGDTPIYTGLKFARTVGDLHYFTLPFAHPGHERFEGCSGAPILSSSGELVALVRGGDIDTNEVYGISTSAYKTLIDILVGKI